MDRINALAICQAIRDERLEEANALWQEILQADTDAAVLQTVKDALLYACRRHKADFFSQWLIDSESRLLSIIGSREQADAAAELLQALVFAACDRRLAEAMPVLRRLVYAWLRTADDNKALLDYFWREWLNLAARMARRGWREETAWLLRITARWLLRQHEASVWQSILQQLCLHFTVQAQWNGFAKACASFAELHYLYLSLIERSAQVKYTSAQQTAFLLLALRNIRDLIANISRSTMQEDMDIFRQWYQFLWQLAGRSERKKQRLRLLLQLAIYYWQHTRPKTSRRQAQFLQDLLNPDLLTEHYGKLLQAIC